MLGCQCISIGDFLFRQGKFFEFFFVLSQPLIGIDGKLGPNRLSEDEGIPYFSLGGQADLGIGLSGDGAAADHGVRVADGLTTGDGGVGFFAGVHKTFDDLCRDNFLLFGGHSLGHAQNLTIRIKQ